MKLKRGNKRQEDSTDALLIKINHLKELAYKYISQWATNFYKIENKLGACEHKLTLDIVVESIKTIHKLDLVLCDYINAIKEYKTENSNECDRFVHYITFMDNLICTKPFSDTSFNCPFVEVDRKVFQSMNTVVMYIDKDFKDSNKLGVLESNIARYFFYLTLIYAFNQDRQRFLSFKYDQLNFYNIASFKLVASDEIEGIEPLTYYFKEVLSISGKTSLNIYHISFGYSVYELGTTDFKRLFDLTLSAIE